MPHTPCTILSSVVYPLILATYQQRQHGNPQTNTVHNLQSGWIDRCHRTEVDKKMYERRSKRMIADVILHIFHTHEANFAADRDLSDLLPAKDMWRLEDRLQDPEGLASPLSVQPGEGHSRERGAISVTEGGGREARKSVASTTATEGDVWGLPWRQKRVVLAIWRSFLSVISRMRDEILPRT